MRTGKGCTLNSPIYSLSFDSEYLFAAVDQNLNVLNFTGYAGHPLRDYSELFVPCFGSSFVVEKCSV